MPLNFLNNGYFAAKVGIGTNSPQSSLEVVDSANYKGIHVRGSNAPNITFGQNAVTTAEWKIGISGFNGDSFSIGTGVSGNDKIHIETDGDVGIGNSGPLAKLDVAGGVRVANDTDTASADKEGTLRYRLAPDVPKSQSMVDMCMKTGPSSYSWVNIVTNTWNN